METQLAVEKWPGEIYSVKIGATAAEGGSRKSTVTVGGQNTLPLLFKEGRIPNPPVIAFEVWDSEARD